MRRQQTSQRVRLQKGSGSAGVHRRGDFPFIERCPVCASTSRSWRSVSMSPDMDFLCCRRTLWTLTRWNVRSSAKRSGETSKIHLSRFWRLTEISCRKCCEILNVRPCASQSPAPVTFTCRLMFRVSQLDLGWRDGRPSGSRQGQHLRQDPPQTHTGRWETSENKPNCIRRNGSILPPWFKCKRIIFVRYFHKSGSADFKRKFW